MRPDSTRPDSKRPALDWELLHARMAAVNRALEQATQLPGAAAERILQERARALAQVAVADADQSQSIAVLEFQLAGENYGLDAGYVQEVCALKSGTSQQICALPGTPDFVLGIVYLRGRMLSVLDLRPLFELAQTGSSEPKQLIVVQDADMEFGLLAETITGVRRLALDQLQAALPTMTGRREAYLLGISPERTAVLAAERLLQDPQLMVKQTL